MAKRMGEKLTSELHSTDEQTADQALVERR